MSSADVQVRFEADINDLKRGLNQVQRELGRLKTASDRTSNQIQANNRRTADSFLSVKKAVASVGVAFVAIKAAFAGAAIFTQITSDVQKMQLQLKAVTDTTQEFARANELVYDVAQKTGTSLTETATIMARFSFAMKEAGGSIESAAIVADTLNKALLVTGATGSEATSVLVQLSQAMTKGQLNGDEFRSLSENAGMFLDILAKSMGTTKSKLKELGTQGKITTADIVKAAKDGNVALTDMFNKAVLPLDRTIQRIKNQALFDLTNSEEFKALTQSITQLLVEMSPIIRQIIADLASLNGADLGVIGSVLLTTLKLIYTIGKAVKAVVDIVYNSVTLVGKLIGELAINVTEQFKSVGVLLEGVFTLDPAKIAQSIEQVKTSVGDALDRSASLFTEFANTTIADMDDMSNGIANVWNGTSGKLTPIKPPIDETLTTETTDKIDKAAMAYAKKFQDAFDKAFTEIGSLNRQLAIDPRSETYDAQIEAAKDQLALNEKILAIRSKFKTAEADILVELENTIAAQKKQLDNNVKIAKVVQDTRDLMASTAIDAQVLDAARLGASQEQQASLRANLELEKQINEFRKANAEIIKDPAIRKAYEDQLRAQAATKIALDETNAALEEMQRILEGWATLGTAVGEIFAAWAVGIRSTEDALRDLLKIMLEVTARAALLKLFGGGSWGNAFNSVVGGNSGGGGGGGVASRAGEVTINNFSGGSVSARRRPDGSLNITVEALAAVVAKGGNKLDSALRQNYGLTRRGKV